MALWSLEHDGNKTFSLVPSHPMINLDKISQSLHLTLFYCSWQEKIKIQYIFFHFHVANKYGNGRILKECFFFSLAGCA